MVSLDLVALRRRTWGEADAREVLSAAAQAGASLASFARVHGLCASRLYWWRDRLRTGVAPAFVPVSVRPSPAVRTEPLLEVRTPGGVTVWVAHGACPTEVAAVVKALVESGC